MAAILWYTVNNDIMGRIYLLTELFSDIRIQDKQVIAEVLFGVTSSGNIYKNAAPKRFEVTSFLYILPEL